MTSNYQSQAFPINPASCSKNCLSTSSKPSGTAQSMSMMPTTLLSCLPSSPSGVWIGTTISLLLSESQAMCPGNNSTSGTSLLPVSYPW